MIKKILGVAVMLGVAGTAYAQNANVSPYSQLGIGNLTLRSNTQLSGMGGVSTAVAQPDGYSMINTRNPASYANVQLTTIDLAAALQGVSLSNSQGTEKAFDGNLDYVRFAFPVGRRAALSFGLQKESTMKYNYAATSTVDTLAMRHTYEGEGGLNSVYLGYGMGFGQHVRLGVNGEYLFGKTTQTLITDITNAASAYPTKTDYTRYINGFTFSYGVQGDFNLDLNTKVVLGYSGRYNAMVRTSGNMAAGRYIRDADGELTTLESALYNTDYPRVSYKLPLEHNFGISVQHNSKWLIAADYRMADWDKVAADGVNMGYNSTMGGSAGVQYQPDVQAFGGSFTNFLKRVEYRLGYRYDDLYYSYNGSKVKDMAITAGFGFPLVGANRQGFYKLNLTGEFGRREAASGNALKENYVNIRLGLVLNERWFQRFRFD